MPHDVDRSIAERRELADENEASWDEPLLMIKEVAAEYGSTEARIRKLVVDGHLKAKIVGGGPVRPRYRIPRSEVERFRAANDWTRAGK